MSKKNTSTITFRIDEKFDEHLRKIAKEQKISLNTLANQIFGNYVDLDVYMEKFGVMKMSKKVFKMYKAFIHQKPEKTSKNVYTSKKK